MSDITPKTNVRFPIAVLISIGISIGMAGGTFAVQQYKDTVRDERISELKASYIAGDSDLRIRCDEKVRAIDERIKATDSKVDKITENNARMLELLGRIDERTNTLVRSIQTK